MEIKVREITTVEEKSVQEVEKELLDKHEKEISNEDTEPVEVVTPKEEDSPLELKEEDVFHILRIDTISRLTLWTNYFLSEKLQKICPKMLLLILIIKRRQEEALKIMLN